MRSGRDPGNVAAHRGYARAMLGLNRPEVAVVHYQAVLGQAPDDLQAQTAWAWPSTWPASTRPPRTPTAPV